MQLLTLNAFAQTTVSGHVALQGVAAGSLAQPLTFSLTSTENTPSGVITRPITPAAADGAFTLANIPAGTYTLGVKGSKWLQKDIAVDTTGGNISGLTVSLLGGDVNGDNQVSSTDFLLLRNAYGSSVGSPTWNANADLNCDGQVSATDYLILRSNYGKIGDPLPPVFQIIGINNGDMLFGDVVVNVSVLNGNLNGGTLSVAVDGTTVDAGDVQLQADGSYAEAMTVATNNSSNGVHTIVVSDGLGHSDTRNVTFSNVITNLVCGAVFDLSAHSDGVPQSSHITATLAAPQIWQVAVQDYNGNTVKSYSGTGSSIDVTWDGTDSQSNVVPDASYDVILTTGAAESNTASPNASSTPAVHRPVAKNSIGASLVLVNDEPSAMVGGAVSGMAYEKFLVSILTPKTGVDFTTAPSPIFTTGAAIASNPTLRGRINSQLSIPCSLIYVYTHGSDVSKPRFSIGGWYWYSKFPLINDGVPSNRRFDVSALTDMAGYDNGNDPPLLAWIDTCQSAGINPLFADYSWADTFHSSQGGCFLGWTGNIGQYGAPQNSIYYCFTAWRNNFWTDLFINGQNIQTSIDFANKTPGQIFPPDYNPKSIYTLYGTGSNSF